MPRHRLLSPEAEAEALRFARTPGVRRYQLGPWGDKPSVREIAQHLVDRGLVEQPPSPGAIYRLLERARRAGDQVETDVDDREVA